jgi:hypothetical protein
MTSSSADLLKVLSSQATPGVAAAPERAAVVGALDFSKMLHMARTGQLASGREVKVARGAGVNFSEDQIKRLSAAADLAESQGATRALVKMDGMAIRLDVAMREVTGVVDLSKVGVITGIDAVVEVPPVAPGTAGVGPGAAAEVGGQTLLKALGSKGVARA